MYAYTYSNRYHTFFKNTSRSKKNEINEYEACVFFSQIACMSPFQGKFGCGFL